MAHLLRLATSTAVLVVGADLVLNVDCSGNTAPFSSVQGALDSCTNDQLQNHVTVNLKGYCWERVHVYNNFTGGVAFIGEASNLPSQNLIIYNVSGSSGPGTFGSWTLLVDADDFTAVNIAVANSADNYDHKIAGQSVAVDIQGDRSSFWGCAMYGAQDTLYTGRLRSYYNDLWINGTVDAIFGEGSAVFDNAYIQMNYTITAQKGNGTTAYIFNNAYIDSYGPADLLLGRPWGPQAATVWKSCFMTNGVGALGWDDWGHGCTTAKPGSQTWCNETFYAEFNSTGPGAVPKARPWWTHQLNQSQADEWTMQRLFGDWTPTYPSHHWHPASVTSPS